jgi:hypothetical protein
MSARIHVWLPVLFSLTTLLAACGGGGSSGSGSSSSGGSNPPPPAQVDPITLTFRTDFPAVATRDATVLIWSSSGSTCTASGAWSGTQAASGTSYVTVIGDSAYTLTCSGAAGATPAVATVNVTASQYPISPAPTSSHVVSENTRTSLDYRKFNIAPNEVVWDATNARLQIATRADSPMYPSSLVTLDPVGGQITASTALDAEPVQIAVSANGQFVYAGFAHGEGVRRYLAATLAHDLDIPVGTANARVYDIAVSPTSPRTIAVVVDNLFNVNSIGFGLQLFVDATPLPDAIDGDMFASGGSRTTDITVPVQWMPDGTRLYAGQKTYANGVLDLAVTSQGLSINRLINWRTASGFRLHGTRAFLDDGRVFSLDGAVAMLGRFTDYNNPYWARAEAVINGKAFSLGDNFENGPFVDGQQITAFDPDTFVTIDSIAFDDDALFTGGYIMVWGSDGIATYGANGLLVARGSFAAAGGADPPIPVTPMVAGAFVPARTTTSNDEFDWRAFRLGANDAITDRCGHLYVTTTGESYFRPNKLLELNPTTGALVRELYVGSEPDNLAVSDDCSKIYVGLAESNAVTRVRAADFVIEARIPMISGEPHFFELARSASISVAPGYPDVIAVAKTELTHLCSDRALGLGVFDGTVERPLTHEPTSFNPTGTVWGATASTLYAVDDFDVFAFDVDATGLLGKRTLFPHNIGTTGAYLFADLNFDRLNQRLFNSRGDVFNVATNTLQPRLDLSPTTGMINVLCGGMTAAHVTDPVSGKLFYASYGDEDFSPWAMTVQTFAANGLTLQGRRVLSGRPIDVDFGFGAPRRVARLGTDGLAVVTAWKFLVLMRSPLLRN